MDIRNERVFFKDRYGHKSHYDNYVLVERWKNGNI
jgi:hypothetical protein